MIFANKTITLQFNNLYNENNGDYDVESYALEVPFGTLKASIKKEYDAFNNCHEIMMLYVLEDINDSILKEFNVSRNDFEISRKILNDGTSTIIASKFLEFLIGKHKNWNYTSTNKKFDLEIDIL